MIPAKAMTIICRGEDGSSDDPPTTESTVPVVAAADQATAFTTLCLSMHPAYLIGA